MTWFLSIDRFHLQFLDQSELSCSFLKQIVLFFTFLSNWGKSLLNFIFLLYLTVVLVVLKWKSGHIRGMASIDRDNFVVFYHPSESEIFGWSGLIRGVASIEGQFSNNLLSQWIWNLWFEWSYKRGTNILQSDWS